MHRALGCTLLVICQVAPFLHMSVAASPSPVPSLLQEAEMLMPYLQEVRRLVKLVRKALQGQMRHACTIYPIF